MNCTSIAATRLIQITLCCALPMTASAQNTVHIPDGARVRVSTLQLPQQVFGTASLQQAAPTALVVATPGGDARITLPLSSVERIDVSEGRPRLLYAALGAGAGLLLGSVIGGAVGAREDPEGWGGLIGLVGGGGAGLTFGAVIGFAYAPERWARVYTNTPTDTTYDVVLQPGARTRRFNDGTIAVRGERNRRAGIVRGAIVLGGIGLVAGSIDMTQGDIDGGELVSTVFGNALIGGALGYLISPRGWQKLPAR